jgi:AraC-like DNA-binding protein
MDQARIVRLQSGFGTRVEVLQATYRSHTFTRHWHDTYTLGAVLAGGGTFWCRGAQHFASSGSVVVIPPGEVHTGSVWPGHDVLSYVAIYLPDGLAAMHSEPAGLRGGKPPEFAAVQFRDASVHRAFRALSRALGTAEMPGHGNGPPAAVDSKALDEPAAEEALCIAIAEVIRGHAEGDRRNDTAGAMKVFAAESRVARVVREVIDDCYADTNQTSLRMLSDHVGVTPFRVIRAFREATGLTPHHYLIQVRVERARRLLAKGTIPSLAALETGFADQSHLIHHFKKYLGITPANYQRCVSRR